MRTRAVVPALVAAVVLALVAGLVLVLAGRDSSAAGRHVVVGVDHGTVAPAAPGRPMAVGARPGPRAAAEHRDGADGRLLPRPGRHDALRRGDAFPGCRLRQRVRRRLALLRVPLQPAHRPVPPPDRRADQHRQHPEPGRPGRRLGGVLGLRQRGPELPGAVAGAGLHDRLRRQVPQPVRDPRRRRPAGPAGLGRLAGAVRCGLPGLGIPEHPARRRAAAGRLPPAASVAGRATPRRTPRTPARSPARWPSTSSAPTATTTAPYFLEVAPYAPHSRTSPTPAYAGDPLFPPAFRDRPGHGRRYGDCGLVRCDRLGLDRLPGYGDDLADNAPRRADGTLAPEWRPDVTLSADRARRRPARPGPDGAVDRPDRAADPRRGGSGHLRGAHLRQRLPPRPARARPRQGLAVRLRRARPAAGHRARRRAGLAHRGGQQHRPGLDVRGPGRASRRRRTAPAPRSRRRSPTRPWTAAATRSSSTPGRRRWASTPTGRTPAAPST